MRWLWAQIQSKGCKRKDIMHPLKTVGPCPQAHPLREPTLHIPLDTPPERRALAAAVAGVVSAALALIVLVFL